MKHLEAGNAFEVADIRRRDPPAQRNGRRRDLTVMRANIATGFSEMCPQRGVRSSAEKVEGQDRYGNQEGLDERLAARPMSLTRTMNAMEQLRSGDGGDPEDFVPANVALDPPLKDDAGLDSAVVCGALHLDEDGAV